MERTKRLYLMLPTATKKTNSKTATADTTSKATPAEKCQCACEIFRKLTENRKDSVFKEKDITTKDENGVGKTTKGYDTDAIYKAVSASADDYNSVLSAAAKS